MTQTQKKNKGLFVTCLRDRFEALGKRRCSATLRRVGREDICMYLEISDDWRGDRVDPPAERRHFDGHLRTLGANAEGDGIVSGRYA